MRAAQWADIHGAAAAGTTCSDGLEVLCVDCFREVLQVEPWDELTMKPVKRGRRRPR